MISPQARAVDNGVLVAVRAEGRLLLVRRRRGVDLSVLGEDALEHRTTFTSFQVEDEAVVHVLLLHLDQSIVQIFRVDGLLVLGHRYETRSPVVRVIDEDVVALRGPEHGALRCFFVARQHGQELLSGHIFTRVRRLAAVVDVLAVGPVEDLAGKRVLLAVRDVVVHEQDDLLLGDALALGDLVGVAGVGLVAVVAVAVRPACTVVVVTAVEMVASTPSLRWRLPRRRRCGRTRVRVSRDPAALEIFDADAAQLPGDDDGPVVLPGALR